jgi:hypothetical protein
MFLVKNDEKTLFLEDGFPLEMEKMLGKLDFFFNRKAFCLFYIINIGL